MRCLFEACRPKIERGVRALPRLASLEKTRHRLVLPLEDEALPCSHAGRCTVRPSSGRSSYRYPIRPVRIAHIGRLCCISAGSGLHTFVLYLGPHIAFFTIKAMKCGRVDLKTAPYDTIQLKTSPSWLEKDCSEFGPSVYPALPGSLVRVPLSSILPQVQLEAILWGLGTALGELPPYFIARAGNLMHMQFRYAIG
ncbi:hypothetical protein GW17_00058995 [Ensete ventricosum]|nr:hypothetical protein GW17_00058995 [Ensete ventricosum]